MNRRMLLLAVTFLTLVSLADSKGNAMDPYGRTHIWAMNFAAQRPWHGPYQHLQYGQPTALVVPPTSHMRQTYSWGVSQNKMYPIHHQYGVSNPGYGYAPRQGFLHTPTWPSHTDQFGVYYVRGPW